jgi:hypothetical protein
MRAILAPAKTTVTNEFIEMADRIHKAWLKVNATNTSGTQHPIPSLTQRTEQHRVMEEAFDRIGRVLERLTTLSIDQRRRPRSISRFRRIRPRSCSRDVNAGYDDDGSASHRIFVIDKYTSTSFLIDTDADVCVYPRSKL